MTRGELLTKIIEAEVHFEDLVRETADDTTIPDMLRTDLRMVKMRLESMKRTLLIHMRAESKPA